MVKAIKNYFLFFILYCLIILLSPCPLTNGICYAEGEGVDLSTKWGPQGLLNWRIGFKPARYSVDRGVLAVDFQDEDGAIISPPLFLNANIYKFLVIRMKASKSFQRARVYWVGPWNNSFSRDFSLPFGVGGNWGPHTYIINVSMHQGWRDMIRQVIISPINDGGHVEISSVEFLEDNPWLKFRAGLQDFFILETNPVPPNLGMIFAITGPMIDGVPFNIYVYKISFVLFLILCLIFSARVAFFFFRDRERIKVLLLRRVFLRSAFWVAVFVFCMWGLVEIKYLADDFKTVAADYQAMWGKTLDEKRNIITGGDFYDYLSFCDRALPPGIGVDCLFADDLSYSFENWLPEKTKYYLFPKYIDRSSPYKLIFKSGVRKLDKTRKYELFAKFKEDEYILKEVR